MRKYILIKVLWAFLLSLSLSLFIPSYSRDRVSTANTGLIKTHKKLLKDYERVPHISSEELMTMESEDYILFDVREKDEFMISHMKDAIWVDPSIDASSFMEKFRNEIGGKTLILYCSVGVRSTRLAEKLLASNTGMDVTQIYNLENGIFGWHNENRPIFQSQDSTDFIHPYNFRWGRMVNRKNLQRYETNGE